MVLGSPTAKRRAIFFSCREQSGDIVNPLNNETRQMIQEKVVAEYERVAGKSVKRQALKP
jgi:DNA-binding cell septation regulator SpoVG